MPPHRILITGAAGFVGRRLSRALLRQYSGVRLVGLRRDPPRGQASNWIVGDVRDRTVLLDAVRRLQPDLVIHLAGQASVAACERDPLSAWDVNVSGALSLAHALNAAGCQATLMAISSAEVYGARFNEGPCNETTQPLPQSVYGRSKLAAEHLLQDAYKGRLIIARPFNHTGPGQDERFALAGFSAQIARMEQGRQAPVLKVGNLSVNRDFLHVDDVIGAYCALISRADVLPDRSTFVVASGVPISLASLVEGLKTQAQVDFSIVPDSTRMRSTDIATMVGDSAALQAATGWRPLHDATDIASDLLRYWRTRARLFG
jgi:GDP-4-dehydro-6-deoxy-D-mannose reductase